MGSMKIISALFVAPVILALSAADDIRKSSVWTGISSYWPPWNSPAAANAEAAKSAEIEAATKKAAAERAAAQAAADARDRTAAEAAEAAARAAAVSGSYARRSTYSYSGF